MNVYTHFVLLKKKNCSSILTSLKIFVVFLTDYCNFDNKNAVKGMKANLPAGIGALILVWELPLLLKGAAMFSPCMIRC